MYSALTQPKPFPPLNFGARETLNSNPDPPTSLANTETVKLINLKALAEHTPDGFYIEDRIIHNRILGTGLNEPTLNPRPNGNQNNPRFIWQPNP